MKEIIFSIIVLLQISCFGQSKYVDLIGIWEIERVIIDADSSYDCSDQIGMYILTFKTDSTYSFNGGGPNFITIGQWRIDGDSIFFFNRSHNSPNIIGLNYDYKSRFKVNSNGILIINEVI